MRRRTMLAALCGVVTGVPAVSRCCAVVELRQYLMVPGRRDDLIALFEREFIESQEAEDMRVIATFRDLDRPDRFVWLRGFADMERRRAALSAFYSGPVWRAHREAANAAMVDSDDVLLLKPAAAHAGFDLPAVRAPAAAAGAPGKGLVTATLWAVDDETAASREFERLTPLLAAAGAAPIAWFVGEHAENTFPALPVRAGARLLAWFARFQDAAQHAAAMGALERDPRWRAAYAALADRFTAPPQTLRLQPTARSLLQG